MMVNRQGDQFPKSLNAARTSKVHRLVICPDRLGRTHTYLYTSLYVRGLIYTYSTYMYIYMYSNIIYGSLKSLAAAGRTRRRLLWCTVHIMCERKVFIYRPNADREDAAAAAADTHNT